VAAGSIDDGPAGGPGGRHEPPGAFGDGGAPLAATPSAGFGIDLVSGLPVVAWSTATALGVLLFAFLFRPARGVALEAADVGPLDRSSLAVASEPAAAPSRHAPADSRPPSTLDDAEPLAMDAAEADLPRWLRPSLRAQRASSRHDLRGIAPESARFEQPPLPGVERRVIGYRLVRVSAEPDDVGSAEVGRVDRGDEVEILDEHEGFLRIRTPNGLEGWVPRVVIVG
jgi:hypothetical protein